MHSLVRHKTYRLIFFFYRPFIWVSMAITCLHYALLQFQNIDGYIGKILLAKLFLCGLLFLFYLDVGSKQKLTFYRNFGISKLGLLTISFLMDAFMTVVTILLLKQF